ncbi:Uncharacterized protein predicted to be involved in DNA repair (RAMP superfamily) [Clostridioides difficile]|uniref:CRISPR-associated protein Cas5 n=1 Tax=Clostridioides difficile TaxID=1496 RepID=UPI0003B2A309|nr:CRISPR-associated protein Cas5 [Clostridioides difficile]OFU41425.1 CRISPR-associated protein Cas5 [Clostridium sp. HMSC19B04]AXU61586.1 CRISPR-associated protein, Cas5t family [Clostridioides difficile]MDU7223145.1 CRISPR-associated protein Cas5 [Clostridioides difficile]CCL11550.1 Putative CRISPR-associated protein [Clostridioides difficile E16]CCL96070.1 Putative CRISPR-associated protein [Clostridioides difficile T61]
MKVLQCKLKQPTAHYRDPKVFQNEYISTLNLPSKTTIMGMITYLCDRRLKSDIDIGIIGTHHHRELEFSRGENIDFWNEYTNMRKGKDKEKFLLKGNYYDYYKEHKAQNSILNYEVLKEVELTIFISCKDDEELEFIRKKLESPCKYANLGRKEDFVIPSEKGCFVKEVALKEVIPMNTRDAIKENIKLKNTYVRVDLRDKENVETIINQGVLIALPHKYKDLEANRDDRVYEFCHYIYVDNDGIYPKNIKVNVCIDTKEVFTWL